MKKEQLLQILEGLGFSLDYDQWNVRDKGWIRLTHDISDDVEFRLIIYKTHPLEEQMRRASNILLKLGQYQKIQQLNSYI